MYQRMDSLRHYLGDKQFLFIAKVVSRSFDTFAVNTIELPRTAKIALRVH